MAICITNKKLTFNWSPKTFVHNSQNTVSNQTNHQLFFSVPEKKTPTLWEVIGNSEGADDSLLIVNINIFKEKLAAKLRFPPEWGFWWGGGGGRGVDWMQKPCMSMVQTFGYFGMTVYTENQGHSQKKSMSEATMSVNKL